MRPSSVAASAGLILVVVTVGVRADQKEVSEVPPARRGGWTGVTVSKDQGKTSSPITPIRLATVSATTVKNQQGVEEQDREDPGDPRSGRRIRFTSSGCRAASPGS